MKPAQGVLILALGLIILLAYLTVRVMIDDGFTFLVGVSLFILAILGFGVFGALGSSFDD